MAGAVAERQERLERAAHAGGVAGERGIIEQLAALVLARGITDLGGAAADQGDRPVAGALHQAQQHDAHQIADMQAVGGAVEADVGGDRLLGGQRIEAFEVGGLVEEAALHQLADELGTMGHVSCGHQLKRRVSDRPDGGAEAPCGGWPGRFRLAGTAGAINLCLAR